MGLSKVANGGCLSKSVPYLGRYIVAVILWEGDPRVLEDGMEKWIDQFIFVIQVRFWVYA